MVEFILVTLFLIVGIIYALLKLASDLTISLLQNAAIFINEYGFVLVCMWCVCVVLYVVLYFIGSRFRKNIKIVAQDNKKFNYIMTSRNSKENVNVSAWLKDKIINHIAHNKTIDMLLVISILLSIISWFVFCDNRIKLIISIIPILLLMIRMIHDKLFGINIEYENFDSIIKNLIILSLNCGRGVYNFDKKTYNSNNMPIFDRFNLVKTGLGFIFGNQNSEKNDGNFIFGLESGGTCCYFYPTFAVNKGWMYFYNDNEVEVYYQSGVVQTDHIDLLERSQVVSSTWANAKKDGTRDKRYAERNNFEIFNVNAWMIQITGLVSVLIKNKEEFCQIEGVIDNLKNEFINVSNISTIEYIEPTFFEKIVFVLTNKIDLKPLTEKQQVLVTNIYRALIIVFELIVISQPIFLKRGYSNYVTKGLYSILNVFRLDIFSGVPRALHLILPIYNYDYAIVFIILLYIVLFFLSYIKKEKFLQKYLAHNIFAFLFLVITILGIQLIQIENTFDTYPSVFAYLACIISLAITIVYYYLYIHTKRELKKIMMTKFIAIYGIFILLVVANCLASSIKMKTYDYYTDNYNKLISTARKMINEKKENTYIGDVLANARRFKNIKEWSNSNKDLYAKFYKNDFDKCYEKGYYTDAMESAAKVYESGCDIKWTDIDKKRIYESVNKTNVGNCRLLIELVECLTILGEYEDSKALYNKYKLLDDKYKGIVDILKKYGINKYSDAKRINNEIDKAQVIDSIHFIETELNNDNIYPLNVILDSFNGKS